MRAIKMTYDLHVPKDDDPTKCPIITMHGMFLNRIFLNAMSRELCHSIGRKVYCVDMRNHGDSPSPNECNSYLMAEDIKLFLQDHNIPKATLVCHSFSCRPASVFAIDHPEQIEKLIFLDFFPYADMDKKYYDFTNGVVSAIQKVVDATDMNRSPEVIRNELRDKIHENKQTTWVSAFLELLLNECETDDTATLAFKYDREATLKFYLEGRYRLPPYGVYDGPVLFLVGGKSSLFKSSVKSEKEYKKYFPKAEYFEIEDASHLLPIEKPIECADAMKTFLEA